MALITLYGKTDASDPAWVEVNPEDFKINQFIGIAMSDESSVLSGASSTVFKASFHMPYALDMTDTIISLGKAGGGATLVRADIRINGSTIFGTSITIDAGETTSQTAATPYVWTANPFPTIAANAKIDFYLIAIDTDNIAVGLKAYIVGIPA